ncbi:MAG: Holliday junction resolvase RuvX [Planctomycetota bacterium]
MRYLAIDYGTKRTGLALCDPTETIVSPLAGLATAKELLGKIVEIVKAEGIEAIVVGLPLNMDGTQSGQAGIVSNFADELKKHVSVPIFFQDERLTTFAAEGKLADWSFHRKRGKPVRRSVSEGGLTRKKKKKRIDALAAAEILQQFLDSKRI